jgi:hypothetical protein
MREESFSVLWGSEMHGRATEEFQPYLTNKDAKRERDMRYYLLKSQGKRIKRSILKGQLRQYWSFGVPCGRSCDVYNLTYME